VSGSEHPDGAEEPDQASPRPGPLKLSRYISDAARTPPALADGVPPWEYTAKAAALISELLMRLSSHEFRIEGEAAIYRTARLESGVVIRGPAVLMPGCSIGPNTLLREGVFVGERAHVGSSCEIKSSVLFAGCALAHLNYVGNSLVGSGVNIEAGVVIANHFNERTDREIPVVIDGRRVRTGVEKFGALIGDNCRIGANSVTTPGTLLSPGTIVPRLTLVDQVAGLGAV